MTLLAVQREVVVVDFVHVVVACLLGKGSVEFLFVQLILGTDHNCIATCQISINKRKTRAISIRATTRKKYARRFAKIKR